MGAHFTVAVKGDLQKRGAVKSKNLVPLISMSRARGLSFIVSS